MHRRDFLKTAAAGSAVLAASGRLHAQETRRLRIATTVTPTSLDPHFHDSFTSTQSLLQIYQPLVGQDETSALTPYLATDWYPVDELTWEVKLREGVTFHDGTPFEPEDIIFSFDRVPNVVGAIAPFTANVRDVRNIEVVDRGTVRFTLGAPDPLFSYKLCQVCMLSRRIHADAELGDFNSGKVAFGTGPYRLKSFTPGESLELVANETYWGDRPAWDEVHTRFLVEAGTRIAALRAGEVDLIDNVPVQDVASLADNPDIALFSQDAFLTIYIALDTQRDDTPYVFDNDGRPLPENPLKDQRVRKAMSLAIDRAGIVARLLSGQGTPADQFAGLLVPDRARDTAPLPFDAEEARALLAEAGYGDGFRLTIHGSNGWFASDAGILQAVAQSLTRIGIRTDVEVMPTAMLQTNARKRDYSVHMAAFNGPYTLISLRFCGMTPDPDKGNGVSNLYGNSNPALDEAMTAALVEMDQDRREALLAQAMHALIDDAALIPILFTKTNWAGRPDRVTYHGNPMSRTSAFYADPV